MTSKDELYIYSLRENLLASLEPVQGQIPVEAAKSEAPSLPTQVKSLSGCNTCGVSFSNEILPTERLAHFKTDFHRLNVRLVARSQSPLSETEFENLVETQSVESISGSDDTEDEELPAVLEQLAVEPKDDEKTESNHSPFVFLRLPALEAQKVYGVYKALFDPQEAPAGALAKLKTFSQEPSRLGISVLLMIGGGHFAGAVIGHGQKNIKGNAKSRESRQEQMVHVIHSKTFHRYTTRRKQGGSQSASDNARGKANSAGSSIRRYNEQALQKEVRELLASWKEYIAKAEHVFIRANGAANRKILVGYEGAEVAAGDKRLKTFPFTTKRATLSEVKKAWARLTYLTVVDVPEKQEKASAPAAKKKSPTPQPEMKLASDIHTEEICALVKKSRVPLLTSYLKKNDLDADFAFTPAIKHANAPTALHYAAAQGMHQMVRVLLVNLKADPTVQNLFGKTAAQVSSTAAAKSAFQVARAALGEDFCDWELAKVGPAKTAEQIAQEQEEVENKQKALTRKLIEDELAKKTEIELAQPKFSSHGPLGGKTQPIPSTSGLSDAQKMRLMREQRARAAEARMKQK